MNGSATLPTLKESIPETKRLSSIIPPDSINSSIAPKRNNTLESILSGTGKKQRIKERIENTINYYESNNNYLSFKEYLTCMDFVDKYEPYIEKHEKNEKISNNNSGYYKTTQAKLNRLKVLLTEQKNKHGYELPQKIKNILKGREKRYLLNGEEVNSRLFKNRRTIINDIISKRNMNQDINDYLRKKAEKMVPQKDNGSYSTNQQISTTLPQDETNGNTLYPDQEEVTLSQEEKNQLFKKESKAILGDKIYDLLSQHNYRGIVEAVYSQKPSSDVIGRLKEYLIIENNEHCGWKYDGKQDRGGSWVNKDNSNPRYLKDIRFALREISRHERPWGNEILYKTAFSFKERRKLWWRFNHEDARYNLIALNRIPNKEEMLEFYKKNVTSKNEHLFPRLGMLGLAEEGKGATRDYSQNTSSEAASGKIKSMLSNLFNLPATAYNKLVYLKNCIF
ncbi:hypothetical protein KY358_03225 [Candidatus Woesearchaeota archaeon]|nr:hypothetical protein [Candidatus Woesearchaeota archaeon]